MSSQKQQTQPDAAVVLPRSHVIVATSADGDPRREAIGDPGCVTDPLIPRVVPQTDQDYEVNLDQANGSPIKLSPIPRSGPDAHLKFNFRTSSDGRPREETPHEESAAVYKDLNYDDVLSKTGPRVEFTLNELINQDEDQKVRAEQLSDQEERGSNRLSSSHIQQEEDNSINPIKDFATKTSRIYADSEASRLNSSVVSQHGIDPFLITNSSVMSTYLYKPQYPPSSGGSQLPSPSKTSMSGANKSTGFRSSGEPPSSRPPPVIFIFVIPLGPNADRRRRS